ncbi:hypothetical protein B0T20DRAFT_472133 [Sordaria brevicollis]|uniref:Uncharacterized protein n=1 Tax=Sordaria brevicollis TaxID=83679 RepID=A0AAE0P2J1_SORBR|nr:hypothetical protein B0T20DRAFT_472133 [Sordaria brevicollis]
MANNLWRAVLSPHPQLYDQSKHHSIKADFVYPPPVSLQVDKEYPGVFAIVRLKPRPHTAWKTVKMLMTHVGVHSQNNTFPGGANIMGLQRQFETRQKRQEGKCITLKDEPDALYFIFPGVVYPAYPTNWAPAYADAPANIDQSLLYKVDVQFELYVNNFDNLDEDGNRVEEVPPKEAQKDPRNPELDGYYGGNLGPVRVDVRSEVKVRDEKRKDEFLAPDYEALLKTDRILKIDEICRLAGCSLGQTNTAATCTECILSSTVDPRGDLYLDSELLKKPTSRGDGQGR